MLFMTGHSLDQWRQPRTGEHLEAEVLLLISKRSRL